MRVQGHGQGQGQGHPERDGGRGRGGGGGGGLDSFGRGVVQPVRRLQGCPQDLRTHGLRGAEEEEGHDRQGQVRRAGLYYH